MADPQFKFFGKPNSYSINLPPKDQRVENWSSPSESAVDMIIYLKNITETTQTQIENDMGFWKVMPGGLTYVGTNWKPDPDNPGGPVRRIRGNEEALELVGELYELIDHHREVSTLPSTGDIVADKYRNAFGDQFVSDKEVGDLTDLAIHWAKSRLKTRFRELNNSVFKHYNLMTNANVRTRHTRVHQRSNEVVHQTNLAEDILWVGCPNVDISDDVFTDTRKMTVAQFEAIYNLRVDEAVAIVYYATQKNTNGTRTDTAALFSWVFQLISQFVEWRTQLSSMWQRRNLNHYQWLSDGGVTLDAVYKQFISHVLRLIDRAQSGPVSEQNKTSFRRMAVLFLAYCDLLQWKLIPQAAWRAQPRYIRETQSLRFPRDTPIQHSQSRVVELLPGVKINSAPHIPPGRAVVEPDSHFYTLHHNLPAANQIGEPPGWDGQPQFAPHLGMAQKLAVPPTFNRYGHSSMALAQAQRIDSEFELDDLYENIVNIPRRREKHVSFADDVSPTYEKFPFTIMSGRILKRRAHGDGLGGFDAKRPRIVV